MRKDLESPQSEFVENIQRQLLVPADLEKKPELYVNNYQSTTYDRQNQLEIVNNKKLDEKSAVESSKIRNGR